MTIIVDRPMHVGVISVLSLAVWLEKNDRHNMTQIAINFLLAVATVFTLLMVCNVYIYSQRGGLYARQNYTYAGI